MNRDKDRLSTEPGFWLFEGEMNPKTQEAFTVLWLEVRRQARLRRRAQAQEDRLPTAERTKNHLKLVSKG